jgi:hypothetical protein
MYPKDIHPGQLQLYFVTTTGQYKPARPGFEQYGPSWDFKVQHADGKEEYLNGCKPALASRIEAALGGQPGWITILRQGTGKATQWIVMDAQGTIAETAPGTMPQDNPEQPAATPAALPGGAPPPGIGAPPVAGPPAPAATKEPMNPKAQLNVAAMGMVECINVAKRICRTTELTVSDEGYTDGQITAIQQIAMGLWMSAKNPLPTEVMTAWNPNAAKVAEVVEALDGEVVEGPGLADQAPPPPPQAGTPPPPPALPQGGTGPHGDDLPF